MRKSLYILCSVHYKLTKLPRLHFVWQPINPFHSYTWETTNFNSFWLDGKTEQIFERSELSLTNFSHVWLIILQLTQNTTTLFNGFSAKVETHSSLEHELDFQNFFYIGPTILSQMWFKLSEFRETWLPLA